MTIYTKLLTPPELKNDLNSALANNEFQLYLQGQFNQESNYIGAEVLLCWQHPTHGLVSPLDFIPITEEIGRAHV